MWSQKKIILSNINRLCKLRDLQNSFIRTSLDEISLERHKILYHVVKNKLIKSKQITNVFIILEVVPIGTNI